MGLKIIPASEPISIETIVLTIYGAPGVGKTSLASSAGRSLLLDCDNGSYRSSFRRDVVSATSWADIAGIEASDVKGYDTLIIDTAGRALDLLSVDIIRTNPKMGSGGSLNLKGWGELKTRFIAFLNLLRSFGLDVVLVAHADEKQQGDDLIERIDMQGSSKNEVYKSSDAMARLSAKTGKRLLAFSPTETAFGKDPADLGQIEVPDLNAEPEFLGMLISRIKADLNELSEEQAAMKVRRDEWTDRVSACEAPEDFTALVEEAWDGPAKRVLHAAAVAAGLEYDADAKCYAQPEEAAA